MPNRFSKLTILAILLTVAFLPRFSGGFDAQDTDAGRAKLLSYVLRKELSGAHYSRKVINDDFSKDAFILYLEQLDYQKRFLLKEDVQKLKAYMDRIDDEMVSGILKLPEEGEAILSRRIASVQKIVDKILSDDFDFTIRESYETDPDKLDFCASEKDLTERWRKALKFLVLTRYLNLKEDETENADDKALLSKAREKVLKNQQDMFARMLKETKSDHYNRFFNAVARTFDPHTAFLPPKTKEDFDISMRGSLEGIGATLREEGGYIKVVRIIPGSPASRQGQLQAEDIILAVAQGEEEPADVTDTRLRDAVSLIRGAKGTEVRLTVKKPDGTRIVIPIVRDVVQIEESFVKSTLLTDAVKGKKFGYIVVPSFYRDFENTRNGGDGRNSTDDVKEAIDSLKRQGMEGLLLDLRNNGGGALMDAVSIAGLFIKKGPVVQVKTSEGRIHILSDHDSSVEYDGPLIVLVNRFSASASEIVAGAIQDYRRGLVIGGSHTHGKGTVQTMIDLDQRPRLPNMQKYMPLGALKLTTQKFYRISGDSTQYRGVEPDIVLPDRYEYLKTGEQYLDHSLPWDTVQPVEYQLWGIPQPTLLPLKVKSADRVEKEEGFVEISELSNRSKERMEKTQQSLFIDDVRSEREETKNLQSRAEGDLHMISGEDGSENSSETAESSEEKWLEDVREDPYVKEGMNIILDMFAEKTNPYQRSSASR